MVVVEKELEVEEGLKLIEVTGAHKNKLVAWDIFNSVFIKAPLEIKSVAVRSKSILLMASTNESKDNLDCLISGSGEINFFVPEVAIGFSAELSSYKKNGLLEVVNPKNFLQFERRDFGRFLLDGELKVSVFLGDKVIKKSCLDISEGGFSLIFNKSEVVQLKFDGKYKCILHLDKREIQTEVVVVDNLKLMPFVNPNAPFGGVRYSFKFNTLDATNREFVINYIKVVKQIKDPAR